MDPSGPFSNIQLYQILFLLLQFLIGKQNETGDSADGAKDVKSRSSDIKSEEPVSTTVAKKSKIAIESSVAEVVSRIDPNAKRKEQIEQAGDTAIRKKVSFKLWRRIQTVPKKYYSIVSRRTWIGTGISSQ